VKNERRWSVDNQPYGTAWERITALSFPADHPFHHSLIGSMEDLGEASLEDVAQFFATYYTPDNAVLTVSGDFQPEEARRLIEEMFGPIPRGGGRPPLPTMTLPESYGTPPREVVEDDVMLPRLFVILRSPVFGSTDYYAASVAGAILGMRQGSRLHRRLVREREVAAEATAFTYDLAKGSDLLVVDVTARPDTGAEALEREVHAELDAMQAGGVTEAEVERAVSLIETETITALQSAGDRADQLSKFATYFRDPSLVNRQAELYRGVTVEQVSRFARERMGRENRATLLYVPKGSDGASNGGSRVQGQG
jgi:zinc protease